MRKQYDTGMKVSLHRSAPSKAGHCSLLTQDASPSGYRHMACIEGTTTSGVLFATMGTAAV